MGRGMAKDYLNVAKRTPAEEIASLKAQLAEAQEKLAKAHEDASFLFNEVMDGGENGTVRALTDLRERAAQVAGMEVCNNQGCEYEKLPVGAAFAHSRQCPKGIARKIAALPLFPPGKEPKE
jgi:hypothetical protein